MDYEDIKREFISEFVDNLEHSNLSVFLGAGMSFEAGLPSWKNLLKSLALKINIDIDKANDYYQIAQYCENRFGCARFRNEIRSLLNPKNYASTIVKNILDLPANNFWTTNFDCVLEKNMEMVFGVHPDIIYRDVDLTKTREKAVKIIFKMNGHIDDQMSWVLTKHDLEEYIDNHQAMLTFFKRELIVNTFLFLGYSFADNLVLSALRDVRRYLGGTTPTHYHYTILTERPHDAEFPHFINNLEKSYGIKSLIIPQNYFQGKLSDNELVAQFDAERINIINTINHRIKMHQIFISGSFREIELEKKIFSSQLAKHITSSILQQGYRICSGVGRGVGSRIVGYASEWLVAHNQLADKRLIMRSSTYHSQDGTNDATKVYRKRLMRDSGIVIFMFGQSETNAQYSEGVWQEFMVAKELGMKIIPLGVTGYASLEIWKEIKNNISCYGYLEKYIDALNSETNVEKLTNIIMMIIKDVQ